MLETHLKLSQKIDILFHLFHGNKISPLIENLENHIVIDLQKFMWEKAVEFGIKSRGKNFNRNEITNKMPTTSVYQKQQNCLEPHYYCKGTLCINTHPDCARKKIKEHVDIMAEVIWEYINYDDE
jgi:hypothetical protein